MEGGQDANSGTDSELSGDANATMRSHDTPHANANAPGRLSLSPFALRRRCSSLLDWSQIFIYSAKISVGKHEIRVNDMAAHATMRPRPKLPGRRRAQDCLLVTSQREGDLRRRHLEGAASREV